MNWKKRYEKPNICDKLKAIKDLSNDCGNTYPKIGETIIISKIENNDGTTRYFFNKDDYLIKGEFEKV